MFCSQEDCGLLLNALGFDSCGCEDRVLEFEMISKGSGKLSGVRRKYQNPPIKVSSGKSEFKDLWAFFHQFNALEDYSVRLYFATDLFQDYSLIDFRKKAIEDGLVEMGGERWTPIFPEPKPTMNGFQPGVFVGHIFGDRTRRSY